MGHDIKRVLEVVSDALDRLAEGEDFDAVIEETGVVCLVTEAKHELADLSEGQEAAAGKRIAEVFRLRRDPEHRGRYSTTEGSKTALGVFRTLKRMVDEASEIKVAPGGPSAGM